MPALRAGSSAISTGASASATLAFTIPSGAQPGDQIAIWVATPNTGLTWSVPGSPAFTAQAQTTGAGSNACQLLTRTMDGTEGWTPGTSTVTVTLSSSAKFQAGIILAVPGTYDPPPSGSGQCNTAASLTITTPGVTTTQAGDLLIWAGFVQQASGGTPGTITVPAGFTPQVAQASTSGVTPAVNVGILMGTGTAPSAGPTGNQNGTSSASEKSGGLLLAVAGIVAPQVPVVAAPGPAWKRQFRPRAQQYGTQQGIPAPPPPSSGTPAYYPPQTAPGQAWLRHFRPGAMTPLSRSPQVYSAAFAATVVTTATGTRSAGRTLTVTVTTAGALTRQAGRTLPATVATVTSLGRSLARALASTDVATASASVSRATLVAFPATATVTGSLARTASRALAAAVTATGSLARQAAPALATVTVTAGSLTRSAARTLAAAVTSAAAASVSRANLMTFPAAVTTAASLIRQPGRTLAVLVTADVALSRQAARALTATVTTSASVSRTLSRTLSAVMTAPGALARAAGRLLRAAVTTTAAVSEGQPAALFLAVTVRTAARLTTTFIPAAAVLPPGVLSVAPQTTAVLTITPAGPLMARVSVTGPFPAGQSVTITAPAPVRVTCCPPPDGSP